MYRHKVALKEIEDVWNFLFWDAEARVLNFELDKISLDDLQALIIFLGQSEIGSLVLHFNCATLLGHLGALLIWVELHSEPDEALLCELLSIQEHVGDYSHQAVLVVLHHLGKLVVEIREELHIRVGELRLDDSNDVCETLPHVKSLEVDLQRPALDLLVVLLIVSFQRLLQSNRSSCFRGCILQRRSV